MRFDYGFPEMAAIIPKQKGKNGWGINHKVIDAKEAKGIQLRSAINHNSAVGMDLIEEGTYAVLYNSKDVVMSDTWIERNSCYAVIYKWRGAHGDILIGGLGLGMILIPLSYSSQISSITVLELNQEVIDLVWKYIQPHFGSISVRLIKADVFEAARKERYN